MFKFIGKIDNKFMIYDTEDLSLDLCTLEEIVRYTNKLNIIIKGVTYDSNSKVHARCSKSEVYLVRMKLTDDINKYNFKLKNSYWLSNEPISRGELYIIYQQGKPKGLLHINRYSNTEFKIENIEVSEQGTGLGRKVIKQLFTELGVHRIVGESLPDTIPFWERMGVDFKWINEEQRLYALDSAETMYFELTREQFYSK